MGEREARMDTPSARGEVDVEQQDVPIKWGRLVTDLEKATFVMLVLAQIALVIFMVVSIVGMFYLAAYATFVTLGTGMYFGYIRGNAVRVTSDQFPDLYERATRIAAKMQMRLPEV